jgi:two-component system nitrate/nitrite response regulator NarL
LVDPPETFGGGPLQRTRPTAHNPHTMKLLIVDDHAIVREGLAAMLRLAGPGIDVLHARDGAEGLRLALAHADLDAVLLDLEMPDSDGMTAIPEFGRQRPDLPVIVLSSSESHDDVRRALALGALGYVPKSAAAHTLLSALTLVLSGNVYVPPLMLDSAQVAGPAKISGGGRTHAGLTARQLAVLRMLSEGMSNKEIGRDLGLSDKTVKAYVTSIFRSLGVVNRTQAAAAARRDALI